MPPKRKAGRPKKSKKEKEEEVHQKEETALKDSEVEEPKAKKRTTRSKKDNSADTVELVEQIGKDERINSIDKIPQIIPITFKDTPTISSPIRGASIASSRIPSPSKRPSVAPRADFDYKRTEFQINHSFSSKNLLKLGSIIDELKNEKSEHILEEFKISMDTRLKASDNLIASLTSKNHELTQEIALLKKGIEEKSDQSNLVVQATNKEEDDDDAKSYESELILDMVEQVVGLRIHRAQETEDALTFDCSQSGKNGFLDYRLTVSKEGSAEILYTPVTNSTESAELKKYLPEYFFDNLTFPVQTLQQFYHKIYRGLNK